MRVKLLVGYRKKEVKYKKGQPLFKRLAVVLLK